MLAHPLVIFNIITIATSQQLLATIVIHRHGDRNPLETYKTDPYRDASHWPEGLGEITKTGQLRQLELGQWLRQRYSDFLPEKYSPINVRARSTDVDRTLISAQLTLAGLYPRLSDSSLPWQPIPVHTVPVLEDAVLALKKRCKKFAKLLEILKKSERIQEILDVNSQLFEYLSDKTGENIHDLRTAELVFNALNTEFYANKTLPQWTQDIYPEKLKPIALMHYKLQCYTPQLARLKIGLLLGEFIDNLNTVDGKIPKFWLYSAHDTTLIDILIALGCFNDEVPSYSSALLLELKKDLLGDFYFVNLLFRNSSGLFELVVDGCEFNCSYSNFTKLLEPVVLKQEEWEKECENN